MIKYEILKNNKMLVISFEKRIILIFIRLLIDFNFIATNNADKFFFAILLELNFRIFFKRLKFLKIAYFL
jgi:hypothetical protein